MADTGKTPEAEGKAVGWKIPEPLRRRLNSHAEYLSVEKEISVGAMVSPWLDERLQLEERKRALATLGIAEKDIHKNAKK